MRKVLLFMLVMLYYSVSSFSQTTYYWVGAAGSAAAPTDWTANWNTAANGTGTARTVSSATDILIFDGTTTTATSVFVGNVPKDSAAQVKLVNGVTVTFVTTNAATTDGATAVTYGAAYGGSVIPVYAPNLSSTFRLGDIVVSNQATPTNPAQIIGFTGTDTMYLSNEGGVNANATLFRVPTLLIKGNPGLTVDATSILNLGATSTTSLQPFAIIMAAGAKGEIFGRLNFQSRGIAARVTAVSPLSLVFKSGGLSVVGGGSSTGSLRGYHYGNPFSTGSAAAGTFAYINDGGRASFERGSTYQHNAQQSSPFGTAITATAPLSFVPAITFQQGSNYLMTYGNGYSPYFYTSGIYANLTWNSTGFPAAGSTTTFNLNLAKVDTLTITQMGTATNSTNSGRSFIYGDYINNSATTSNFGNMMFAGSGALQKISGSNTGSTIGNLFVLDQASVALDKNISVVSGVNILGKLDAQNFTITAVGTPTFNNYGAFSKTYDSPTGSGNAIGGAAITAGSTTIQLRNVNNTNSNIIGSSVTSTSHPSAIQPGTIITGYVSGGNFTMSKPALQTADSASTPTLSVTISNGAGTFSTANTGGMNGSLPSFINFTLGSTANYIFNGATTTPFPSSTASTLSLGNLSINANVSLNKTVTDVVGTLTLNTNTLTVNSTDTLKLNQANAVIGTFGPTAHINTVADAGSGNFAVVQSDNLATTRTFPVGNNGYYLPVTITPQTASSFAMSVKQGATANGKPNGAVVADKSNIVDANYIVNRITGAGNATLRLQYPTSLKGSGFATIQNHQVGISRYDEPTTTWETPVGGGDNTANFAQASFSNFSPFRVAVNLSAVVLPVNLGDVTAIKVNGQSKISWKVYTEQNIAKYIVERSVDGRNFTAVGSLNASGTTSYSLVDPKPATGKNLYRIKVVSKDNSVSFSKIVLVDFSALISAISISPNPVSEGIFTVNLSRLNVGKVSLKMYNNNGQLVLDQPFVYDGSNANQLVTLPANIAKGIYQLVVSDGLNVQNKPVVVQ